MELKEIYGLKLGRMLLVLWKIQLSRLFGMPEFGFALIPSPRRNFWNGILWVISGCETRLRPSKKNKSTRLSQALL